jgi:hypothetical protein
MAGGVRETRTKVLALSEMRRIAGMIRDRQASWGGGKPYGSRKPPKVKGPSVADAVIRDRR